MIHYLTPRQAEALQVIRDYFDKFDTFPTLRAIIARMGYGENCTNAARGVLQALERKGYIEKWADGTGGAGWRFTRVL
jgi:sulfur relay (sulfurtransferase) DsrC/TusE family protein